MKIFTIENETNNITIHTSEKEAEAVPAAQYFGAEAALAKLAANWPTARLIEIWNSLPGTIAVRKFENRRAAVSRIWKAIQSLQPPPVESASVAPHTPSGAPVEAAAPDNATQQKETPAGSSRKGPREGSKTEAILELMKQPGGSTLQSIMETTRWQAHSVRGFISGTLGRKMGLRVISTRDKDGLRTYSINA